jgi:hypothetical protein
VGLYRLDENRQLRIEWRRVAHGLWKFREHLLLENLASLVKGLAPQALSRQHEDIET